MIAQAAVGGVAMNVIRPYAPTRDFAIKHVRRLLQFGIAYQGKTLTSFANASVTPLIGGSMLGSNLLGINNFAQNLAYFPIMLVNIISRVSFPLYSRLQDDENALAAEINSAIRLSGSATLMFVGLCFGLGKNIITVVYGEKWLPSLPLVYVYASVITIGFLSPVLSAAFDAIGKPHILFRLSIAWTVINWAAVLIGTAAYRTVFAFAVAYAIHVVAGNLALVYVARKIAPGLKVFQPIAPSLLAAAAMAAIARYVFAGWAVTVGTFIAAVVASILLFAALLALLDRGWLRAILGMAARLRPKQEAVPTRTA
jgi:O-antigen/teichoic acid export membrane protein